MVVAAVAGAVVGLISVGDDEPASLPAEGRAPTGVGYELSAVKDCLALDLDRRDEIEVIGDEEPGDIRICDFASRGRAEGELVLACGEKTAFVFGVADEGTGALMLEPRRGEPVEARRFAHDDGTAFVVAAPLDALPARLREEGTDAATELQAPGDACDPIPDGTVPDLPSAPVRVP